MGYYFLCFPISTRDETERAFPILFQNILYLYGGAARYLKQSNRPLFTFLKGGKKKDAGGERKKNLSGDKWWWVRTQVGGLVLKQFVTIMMLLLFPAESPHPPRTPPPTHPFPHEPKGFYKSEDI